MSLGSPHSGGKGQGSRVRVEEAQHRQAHLLTAPRSSHLLAPRHAPNKQNTLYGIVLLYYPSRTTLVTVHAVRFSLPCTNHVQYLQFK